MRGAIPILSLPTRSPELCLSRVPRRDSHSMPWDSTFGLKQGPAPVTPTALWRCVSLHTGRLFPPSCRQLGNGALLGANTKCLLNRRGTSC